MLRHFLAGSRQVGVCLRFAQEVQQIPFGIGAGEPRIISSFAKATASVSR
jgi:hypothetical protein